jgi:dihydropteroate synthase
LILSLGDQSFELSARGLVMGILNRTRDSFFDRGAYFELDALLAHAERLISEGADILDVGGVKAGPGPEVSEQEEMDRVVPAIEALRRRIGTPVSVDTWRASVASQSYAAGAVMGNDISGFADPGYLTAAAAAGAAVVATHIRLAPRVGDPDPHYDDVIGAVETFLRERTDRALTAGVRADRIIVDAGLDLGKTWRQSLELLRASDRLAALGYPLLVSASNKTFLGALLSLDVSERRDASLAAAALGLTRGCRIVRVHDVAGSVRVRDVIAAIIGAGRDRQMVAR